MSTPKIKVYRLDKGYNQDSDNDIQSKVNSELLPFIKKSVKSTDAYYLTGLSDQIVQLNGKKINTTPQYEKNIFSASSETSDKINCTTWITKGFYRPRLGYFSDDVFYELADEKYSDIENLEKITEVQGGNTVSENYFTTQDFIHAHPFIFGKDKELYTFDISNDEITFTLNKEEIGEESPVETNDEYVVQYYTVDDQSKCIVLENYPIYNNANYFYCPKLFNSTPEELNIEVDQKSDNYRKSLPITCDDSWIYYGDGEIIVTYKEEEKEYVLGEKDYELLYSYSNAIRSVVVKISEDCLSTYTDAEKYVLYYNKCDVNDDSFNTLINNNEYTLDDNTGLLTFNESVPDNLFIWYRKKTEQSTLFVSEFPNWSFGHLRENPDIFFGEEDYPGDESENTETGAPIYSGLKPRFISKGYQIDYFRGSVMFTDGVKTVSKSDAENLQDRDEYNAECFVRANFSYYPEVHGVFRQKFNLTSEVDGFTYKPADTRFHNSIGKRWIMKNDSYQPMFFENFTDSVNVCSRYLSTAPGYDQLSKKEVKEILSTDNSFEGTIPFILPLVKSKFIVFNGFEEFEDVSIHFIKKNNDESDETIIYPITLKRSNDLLSEIFSVNGKNLTVEVETEIIIESENENNTDKLNVKLVYLNTYRNSDGVRTDSFQIVSAEINEE